MPTQAADLSSARRYLRMIQEQYAERIDPRIRVHPPTADALRAGLARSGVDPNTPEAEAAITKMMARYAGADVTLEDPGALDELERLWSFMASGTEDPAFVLGTLPTGRINAMTIPVPRAEACVVVVDRALFSYAHQLVKSVIRVLPWNENAFVADLDLVRDLVQRTPALTSQFYAMVAAYARDGDPRWAPPAPIEPRFAGLLQVWRDSIELFALSHEVEHARSYLAGHGRPVNLRVLDMAEIQFSWNQECLADAAAVGTLLARIPAAHGVDAATAISPAYLYFAGMSVLAKAVSVMRLGAELEPVHFGTHPPAAKRLEMLNDSLPDVLPGELAAACQELGGFLAGVVALLWDSVRPRLERDHHLQRMGKWSGGPRPL